MRITKWLKKKSNIIASITGILSICILTYQTFLFRWQTKILDTQTQLLSNQIQSSTNPYLEIKVVDYDGESDSLLITNSGKYKIQNIELKQVYFVLIKDHGWWYSEPFSNLKSKNLLPSEKASFNISLLRNMYKQAPIADSFSIVDGTEFLIFLVLFERVIDGKAYMSIHPTSFVRRDGKIELWPETELQVRSGPLGKTCHIPIELIFEYFKKLPLKKNIEIYNFNYPFGYEPTGCLGPIVWVN